MAVPQRRTSKTRKRLRRTHFKLQAKGLVTCKHCGALIQSHKVCPFCGYYDGKLVVKVKAKEVEETDKKKKKNANLEAEAKEAKAKKEAEKAEKAKAKKAKEEKTEEKPSKEEKK